MFSLHVDWAHKDDFPINPYYIGNNGRIILTGGFCNHVRIFHLFRKTDVIISLSLADHVHEDYLYAKRMIEVFDLDVKRVFFLCGTKEETKRARECGLVAIFCNQNAFLNDNVFRHEPKNKIYDAVLNSRMIKWKRAPLASKVSNLVILAGHKFEDADYDDPKLIPHAKLYEEYLNPDQVREVILESYVGLILSEKEGACMASSEYLLCGVPVISTHCSGGREIWYDDYNSIICDPLPESVADAVNSMIARIKSGNVDPLQIRKRHLEMAKSHKSAFVEVLSIAFNLLKVSIDADEYYRNKPRLWDRSNSLSYTEVCKNLG